MDAVCCVLHYWVDSCLESFHLLPHGLQAGTSVEQVDDCHICSRVRLKEGEEDGFKYWTAKRNNRQTSALRARQTNLVLSAPGEGSATNWSGCAWSNIDDSLGCLVRRPERRLTEAWRERWGFPLSISCFFKFYSSNVFRLVSAFSHMAETKKKRGTWTLVYRRKCPLSNFTPSLTTTQCDLFQIMCERFGGTTGKAGFNCAFKTLHYHHK